MAPRLRAPRWTSPAWRATSSAGPGAGSRPVPATPEDHATDVPGVAAVRALRTWGLWDPSGQVAIETLEGRNRDWHTFAHRAHLVTVALAIAGFVVLGRRHQRRDLALLLAPVVLSVLVSMASWGNTRYRAGADVVLAVAAARRRRCRPRAAGGHSARRRRPGARPRRRRRRLHDAPYPGGRRGDLSAEPRVGHQHRRIHREVDAVGPQAGTIGLAEAGEERVQRHGGGGRRGRHHLPRSAG